MVAFDSPETQIVYRNGKLIQQRAPIDRLLPGGQWRVSEFKLYNASTRKKHCGNLYPFD